MTAVFIPVTEIYYREASIGLSDNVNVVSNVTVFVETVVLCEHRILTKVDELTKIQKSRIFTNFMIINQELGIERVQACTH